MPPAALAGQAMTELGPMTLLVDNPRRAFVYA